MDLNYLYHRHQVSLFMAENAATAAARQSHRDMADHFARRIGAAKNEPSMGGAA